MNRFLVIISIIIVVVVAVVIISIITTRINTIFITATTTISTTNPFAGWVWRLWVVDNNTSKPFLIIIIIVVFNGLPNNCSFVPWLKCHVIARLLLKERLLPGGGRAGEVQGEG